MKIEEPISINKLPDLASVELHVPKIATSEKVKINENVTHDVLFHGVSLKLDIHNYSSFKNHNVCSVVVEVDREEYIIASITLKLFRNFDDTYKIYSDVKNTDRALKGLGRTLWEMSLKLIPKLASELHVPIIHEVNSSPDLGLSQEKWGELFLPLLEKYGYKAKANHFFEKTYEPT